MLVALAIAVALGMSVLDHAYGQARIPFGIGGAEGMARPPGNALVAWLLAQQSEFSRAMTIAVRGLHQSPAALASLLGLGFAYGVFHAAGPGHGKAVISSYVVADAGLVKRGFLLALAAALWQGVVATVLVLVLARLFQLTAIGMTNVAGHIETASYALIVVFGLWLTLRKGRAFAASFSEAPASAEAACDHVHLPEPEAIARLTPGQAVGIVLSAGSRPCTGSILVLVYALSQGLVMAGIATVAVISLGTALTTGLLATFAVYAKQAAVWLASGRSRTGERIGRGIELAAAIAVTVLGAALLAGYIALEGA